MCHSGVWSKAVLWYVSRAAGPRQRGAIGVWECVGAVVGIVQQ